MNRKLLLGLVDTAAFLGAFLVAVLTVGTVGAIGWIDCLLCAGILYVTLLVARLLMRIYLNVWRYASVEVFIKMIATDAAGTLIGAVICLIVIGWGSLATTLFAGCLTAMATVLSRLFYRYHRVHKYKNIDKDKKINVAIVGAGAVGVQLAMELLNSKTSHYYPFVFIDKDPIKAGKRIAGIRVLLENEETLNYLKQQPIQEIFIAIPKMTGEELNRLRDYYAATGCKIKIYDRPISHLNDDREDGHRMIRDFRIEDLLFRHSLEINSRETRSFYENKVIMVTGGGGSIGSELCRQLAKCHPKRLIILDIYENNAYDIQQELIREYGEQLDLRVEIASVRDRARLACLFDYYRPEVVFHAAAHKHVPLMEHSNCEAIKNNVMGTYNVADIAEQYGTERFILISTDKAVNPTNIMGASKRMCEMVIQCRTDSKTSFAAVRFGNVLGSNGSVIPLFRRQIEQGGPITLTDKRIIRYFMTIPEASQLVMQAGAMAKRGELFVLDMGRPVKILDLAENMIRLSGYTPYKDIDIVEIGLRPGEKLYEELLIANERMSRTENKMIFIEYDTPLSREAVEEKLAILRNALETAKGELESEAIRKAMKEVVPSFRDPEEINSQKKELQKQGCVK
ncbi:MAG: polysaccharide biosynthesis protein [Clostridia bacterium]|nr:polysaccharide biosynthesis protein [Clostridia bacterium]